MLVDLSENANCRRFEISVWTFSGGFCGLCVTLMHLKEAFLAFEKQFFFFNFLKSFFFTSQPDDRF